MTEIETIRHNPLIDPSLHIWGWEIAVYLFLGGITAGIMILTAIAGRRIPLERQSKWFRWMPFLAPVVLSIGMLALFFDLENKLHVFRFYTAFRLASPMSWGSWILLLIYPAAILFGLARLTDEELGRVTNLFRARAVLEPLARFSRKHLRSLQTANLVLGIALGGYTGILLGTLGARAAWSSVLLGPLFLVSGFSTGAALMMLFAVTEEEHRALVRWDIAAIGVELFLLFFFFIDLVSDGGEKGRAAAALFLGGAYTSVFWALVVIAGLGVPLTIELFESRRHLRASIAAPVLLLCGGLALRWILVLAGQAGV